MKIGISEETYCGKSFINVSLFQICNVIFKIYNNIIFFIILKNFVISERLIKLLLRYTLSQNLQSAIVSGASAQLFHYRLTSLKPTKRCVK